MKAIKSIFILILLLFLLEVNSFAKDTDIYVLDQSIQQIQPDVLLILDLSGSMKYTPAGSIMYVADGTYCSNSRDCPSNTVFYATSSTGYTKAVTIDQNYVPKYSNSTCNGNFYFYKDTSDPKRDTECSRVAIAKRAVFKILDADENGAVEDPADQTALSMRFGYMRFHDCNRYSADSGTDYSAGCNKLIDQVNTSYVDIWNAVSGADGSGGTHLTNACKEAKLYYDDTKTGNADEDIDADPAAECRKKFVILITDGADTFACSGEGDEWQGDMYKRRRETVARVKALADAKYMVFVVGFGANFPYFLKNTLNWAAYYGGTDNPAATNSGSLTAYTIDYNKLYPTAITYACQDSNRTCYKYSDLIKTPSKKTTCTAGSTDCYCFATTKSGNGVAYYDPGEGTLGGYAFLAENASQLNQAMEDIRGFILEILAESTSYVAPVVPISQMERTSSGNRMYLGMFKPTVDAFWKGNIKKYGIATENTETYRLGDIIDAKTPPEFVMDAWNNIKDTALSYWSLTADGGEVDKGGVGQLLVERDFISSPRDIYTYLGNPDLTNSTNHFDIGNKDNIPLTTLGVSTDAERQNIINYIHGLNPYGESTSRTDGKRDWILGSFIHSRPLVIHYPDPTPSRIYAGANDGMLHAFRDTDGLEVWAFIPPNLLGNLKNFHEQESLQIFVDGSPKVYESPTQKILVFGQRRGGDRYIALDITTPRFPKFHWEIGPSTIGTDGTSHPFEKLGQTWSTPKIGRIKNGTGEKWVVIFAGGYDPKEDTDSNPPYTMGTAVYIVDIADGSLIKRFSVNDSGYEDMTYPIPSDITTLDINGDGFIDRLYVGDLGGRMWRFDIGDLSEKDDPTKWYGKIIFFASGKIFYPPDVSLERDDLRNNYEMIFFGTGDREDPKNTTFANTLYAVKDYDPTTPLQESNLMDVTSDVLQDPTKTDEEKETFRTDLNSKMGWYIRLEGTGEKCLAGAVIFSRAVYYTTYIPPGALPEASPCTLGEGSGSIYVVNYKTGNAVFNLDAETTGYTKEDRSMDIGSGIPSGVIVTILNNNAVAYAGVGGGVYSPELTSTRSVIPINWRIVF